MTLFNVDAAKTHLSRLIEQAAAGEEIVIARAGRPVARLVPTRRATVRCADIAQAIAEGLTLITRDSRLRSYPIAVIAGSSAAGRAAAAC